MWYGLAATGPAWTSVVVVADGCLTVYACVCVCVFACLFVLYFSGNVAAQPFYAQTPRSPLSTYTNAHNSTHAHTHKQSCCCCCLCYSVVVVAVGAAVVFISFRRNGRCQNEFERASERLCWTESNQKKLKEAKQQTEE